MNGSNTNNNLPPDADAYLSRLREFLRDLEDIEYAPCGCWKSKRTGETFIFCAVHIQDDEAE